MEIRFFVRIRGALTPPPNMLTPVAKIPLERKLCFVFKCASMKYIRITRQRQGLRATQPMQYQSMPIDKVKLIKETSQYQSETHS